MNVTNNLKLPQYTGEDIFDLQNVNKAYDSIDKAYGNINNTYKEVVNIKDEIPKTNATAEVINARGDKETLGKRLDEFGSQLDNKVNKSDIETINLQLDTIAKHTNKILKTSSYERLNGETTDRGRFNRLLEDANDGDTIVIDEYSLQTDYNNKILKKLHFIGLGRPVYDYDNKTFLENTGTWLKNTRLDIKTSGVSFENLAIDALGIFDNGVQIDFGETNNVKFKNVALRGNSHGALIQSYNGDVSNITFEDCHTFDGIHGFAIKANNISLINCTANNHKTNGFVLVSDNILSVDNLGNCYNNVLDNCRAYNCSNGYNLYSRDSHISDDNTNVKFMDNTLVNCIAENCNKGYVIGESSIPLNYVQILPIDRLKMINCKEINSVTSSIELNNVTNSEIEFYNTSGSKIVNNITKNNNNLLNYKNNLYELGSYKIDNKGSTYINPLLNSNNFQIVIIRNTENTTVNRVSNEFTPMKDLVNPLLFVVIDDNFTTLSNSGGLLLNSSLTGKGKWVLLCWNETYWKELTRG